MISSTISFSSLPEEQIILLQLEPALINKRLTIKSSGQNGSVICTPDATFMLKDVQQSNSLLFLTTDAEGEDLTLDYNAKSWLEIVPVLRPKIDLSMIPTWDGEGETSSVTRNSIEGSIAASSREVQEAMFEGLCVCLDATRIVRLDSNYCLRLLNLIVNTAIANDLDLATISEDQVLTVMQDDHENTKVIKFLLARFSKYPCSRKLTFNLIDAETAYSVQPRWCKDCKVLGHAYSGPPPPRSDAIVPFPNGVDAEYTSPVPQLSQLSNIAARPVHSSNTNFNHLLSSRETAGRSQSPFRRIVWIQGSVDGR